MRRSRLDAIASHRRAMSRTGSQAMKHRRLRAMIRVRKRPGEGLMTNRSIRFASVCLILLLATLVQTHAASAKGQHWVAAWTASAHGPYPIGNPTAQPELKLAFPDAARGAADQSFRMIVRPDVWGKQVRIRLSNAFGTRPDTFDGVFAGLQTGGSAVLKGTNRAVTFGGNRSVTVEPGKDVVSDAVA